MGHIDRQRIEAVRHAWHDGAWQRVASDNLLTEADAMHAALVRRADELKGCTENSPEEAELANIAEVIDAYEAKRWPLGKIPGGKG